MQGKRSADFFRSYFVKVTKEESHKQAADKKRRPSLWLKRTWDLFRHRFAFVRARIAFFRTLLAVLILEHAAFLRAFHAHCPTELAYFHRMFCIHRHERSGLFTDAGAFIQRRDTGLSRAHIGFGQTHRRTFQTGLRTFGAGVYTRLILIGRRIYHTHIFSSNLVVLHIVY